MRKLLMLTGAAVAICLPALAQNIVPMKDLAGATSSASSGEDMPPPNAPSPADASVPLPPAGHEVPIFAPAPLPAGVEAMKAPSTKGYMDASRKLQQALAVPYSGDADLDFARLMLVHQQAAMDMAKVLVANGKDPDIRMVAGDVMKASSNEIEALTQWMAKHGPNETKADKPKPPVVRAKVPAKPISQVLEEHVKPAQEKVEKPVAKADEKPVAKTDDKSAPQDAPAKDIKNDVEPNMPLLDGPDAAAPAEAPASSGKGI